MNSRYEHGQAKSETMQVSTRQMVPLALLYSAEGHQIKGRTRFQKLAFLTNNRLSERGMDLYEFIEYDYGPFSRELLDDLEDLEKDDIVRIETKPTFAGSTRYDYKLTSMGIGVFHTLSSAVDQADDIKSIADDVVEEHNEKSIRQLLDEIYEEFPRFQEKSVYY